MKKNIFLSLLIALSAVTTSWSQDHLHPYKITADTAAYTILPAGNWQMIADTMGNLTLDRAINSNLFQNKNQKINYKVNVYWQRYKIINTLSKDTKIALPEASSRADLFTKINNGQWKKFTTGTGVKWSIRDGLKRIPAFLIDIPSGDTLTVYKRMYWNFIESQPDSLSVYVAPADKLIMYNYVEDESTQMISIQGAFILALFILSMIFSFYFFRVVQEKEFLYFSLYLFLSSMEAIPSLNDVFLREYPQFLLYLYIFSNSLIGFVLIHAFRQFLKTSKLFPGWDKVLIIFSFLYTAVLLFSHFASTLFRTNLAHISHLFYNIFNLASGVILLITLLLYVRKHDREIRMMIIAFTPVLLLEVLAYTELITYGLYAPRLGVPAVSGYATAFDKAAFFILILCVLWMIAFFNWVMFLRFSNVRKELAEQSSLDHLKSRFFANISHEFRTPLTLIIGPIEDLLQDKNAQKFKEPLQYIHRNSKRLLQLINQLLDLSRLDVGNYEVNTTREDVIPFVKQIVHSFSSMAHRKNILLETEVDPRLKDELRNELIRFYFDEDIFEKILYNLLSNAFKFTPEDGNIIVSICLSENNFLELKVEDTGTGIPSEKLPFIFDRFYQADNSYKRQYEGTGIGLALVKELVELHHGTITVKSSAGNQTTFSCYFPFNKKILSKNAAAKILTNQNAISFAVKEFPKEIIGAENKNSEIEESAIDIAKPTVLVVEDQQDVRKYICDKLTEIYTVIEAKNGQDGFESAKQHIPDLVISDVMMPKMDGFELCKLLKTDDFTSHIPVILLTARAEDIDKLTGLETGADAYLIKPFNSKELLLRVHNLIELRNKLRKKFGGKLIVKPSEITVTSQDSQFMQRLLQTVEKHIDDEKFSVEELGHEFGMSPSQINRKLKAIINQSASVFIRSVRMERAMQLLKNDQATVAEVAYETGFSEPAYFSRVFKNHFGYSPSEVKKEES